MTLLYFILMLGIIVFIHELGHFLWAKKFGVYCYEFSLGFGPKLFSFRRKNKKDETLYCIRLIPVGGYVAMAGEEADDDKSVPKEKKLYNKTWYQKLIIVLAGVTHNFILGFVVLLLSALIYGSYETRPIIGTLAYDSASKEAGVEIGDRVTEINGKKMLTWDDVTLTLTLANNEKYQDIVLVDKNGNEKTLRIKPKKIKDKDGNVSYAYGMGLSETKNYGVISSIKYACVKFGALFKTMFVTVKSLFTGKVSINALSGPVGIYSIVGQQRKAGMFGLMYLLAYLSINVGFINLLPFPAFDGYRAVITIIEKITKKKVNQKVDGIVNTVGLILLFVLMGYITIKDILKLF